MKNKKKVILIGSVAAVLTVAIALGAVLIPKIRIGRSEKEAEAKQSDDPVVAEVPVIPEPEFETLAEETMEDDGTGLQPIIEEPEAKQNAGKKAATAAAPAKKQAPAQSTANTGVVIGTGQAEVYSCGAANHHCDGPETHAFIQNLENDGCPTCGSHTCPSFYATDEWGHTCYTPSKCPKYNVKKDPVYTCQTCKKPTGDGRNGTCVTFNADVVCPNCGEAVPAWTCHQCK
ncbi:MAG: hypothetical protein IJT66_05900 [Clostridia bacterium]|nr:hypothetical protein [Clostridia bacterium]